MSTFSIAYLAGIPAAKNTEQLKDDGTHSWSFPEISSNNGRNDIDWSGFSPSTSPETFPGRLSSSSSSSPSSSSTNNSLTEEKESPSEKRASKKDKPGHSYIALISMAILKSPEKKLLLGDIYEYIMTTFPYYNNKEKAWRNSIRHNLSLNECFIKSGRADNGKGNYWSIHPACVEDFSCGDFRRRQARRRARKTITQGRNVTDLSMNIGYVPMTSSNLPYSSSTYPTASLSPYQMSPAIGSSLYPALSSSLQFSDVSSFYQNHLNFIPSGHFQAP